MNNRISTIKAGLTAFENTAYTKKDVLTELLKLQDQMGNGLPELKATKSKPRINDILKYFKTRNADLKNVATTELNEFEELSAQFGNRVSAEISGLEGERLAYKSLQTISRPCKLLRNVELKFEDHVTEIDIVAITNGGIFLVEVKNSIRDIIITENGNYKRVNRNGEIVLDKNIGVQMNEKEHIMRSVLKSAGIENVNIQSLVVFTNSKINVDNRYPYIKECFLSDLPHIIENYENTVQYRIKTLNRVAEIIIGARSNDSWPIKMDIPAFKEAYAKLLDKLQTAEGNKSLRWDIKLASLLSGFFKKAAKAACFMFN